MYLKKKINEILSILPKIIEQIIKEINNKNNNNQNISYVQYNII